MPRRIFLPREIILFLTKLARGAISRGKFIMPIFILAWFFVFGQTAKAADIIWDNSRVRVINSYFEVNHWDRLIIKPGTIIKMNQSGYIAASGNIIAQGSPEQPIIFTSIKDDSAGGDTNGDGGATKPAMGDWGYIIIGGEGNRITFDYVEIHYAGGADSGLGRLGQYMWPTSFISVTSYDEPQPLKLKEINITHSSLVNNFGAISFYGDAIFKISDSNLYNDVNCPLPSSPNWTWKPINLRCDNLSLSKGRGTVIEAPRVYWGHPDGPTTLDDYYKGIKKGTRAFFNINYIPFLIEPWPSDLIGPAQKPDPVILVPGIGACLNLKVMTGLEESSWSWDLVGDYYQGLIKTLEAAGFTQGENLFIGCYDWRKTNGLNPDAAVNSGEEYLRHWIDEAKEKSGAQKVDIIAHSMGGLVARSYIQGANYQTRNDVDQLIMLGTPNHGSSFAYYPWEGGEIPQNWQELKKYLTLYLTLLKFKGLNVTNVSTIHEFIPSIKQLLPTYDYLFDTVRQLLVPGSAMAETNNWLNSLNNETEIAKLRSRVRAQIIYGDGKDTLNEIPVSERSALDIQLGKWIDGKPVAEQVEHQPNGDGTVMNTSAPLPGVTSIALPGIEHSALPDQAALKIMQALGIQSEQVFSSPDTKSELMFLVASPVFPLVTTPDGTGQIGYDAATDNLINTIDGARYFSAGNGETKLIIIPNPADGEYSLELTGNADGEYHLASSYFSDTQSIVKETTGEVADEQVINYPVNLQSSAEGDNILPELAPEKEEESVVIGRVIADIEAMLTKGWIKDKQSAQELIQPLKRLSKQLDSINKQTARIKKLIDKINANTKLKPKAKEKILQALNRRLAKLPTQRAKFIKRNLASFNKNLENLKKKNKINIDGYNALIKSINILRKIL